MPGLPESAAPSPGGMLKGFCKKSVLLRLLSWAPTASEPLRKLLVLYSVLNEDLELTVEDTVNGEISGRNA